MNPLLEKIQRAASALAREADTLREHLDTARKQVEFFKAAADGQADTIRDLEAQLERAQYALRVTHERLRAAEARLPANPED